MDRWERWLTAAGLVVFGLVAWRLTSGQFPGCLGPIGVTNVECIAVTGIAPTDWVGPPIAVLAIAAAWWTVQPLARRHWRRVFVAGIPVVTLPPDG